MTKPLRIRVITRSHVRPSGKRPTAIDVYVKFTGDLPALLNLAMCFSSGNDHAYVKMEAANYLGEHVVPLEVPKTAGEYNMEFALTSEWRPICSWVSDPIQVNMTDEIRPVHTTAAYTFEYGRNSWLSVGDGRLLLKDESTPFAIEAVTRNKFLYGRDSVQLQARQLPVNNVQLKQELNRNTCCENAPTKIYVCGKALGVSGTHLLKSIEPGEGRAGVEAAVFVPHRVNVLSTSVCAPHLWPKSCCINVPTVYAQHGHLAVTLDHDDCKMSIADDVCVLVNKTKFDDKWKLCFAPPPRNTALVADLQRVFLTIRGVIVMLPQAFNTKSGELTKKCV
ncbi:unnamed protein product, partial [Mesorhabditis spiculigera]